jgi:group I intron endonuclease
MMYVYVIRNVVNGKVYVGQTHNVAARRSSHFYAARKGLKRPLYCAIRKYGIENFLFETLEECEEAVIDAREQYWVSQLDSCNPEKGYNLTSGGKQYRIVSEATIQKIRAARAKQVITDEHRQRISEGLLRTSQTEEVKSSRREGQAKRQSPGAETLRKRAESNKAWIRDNPEAALLTRQKPRRCSRCGKLGHNKNNRDCTGGGN